ncbi:hypothetical protein ACWGJT_33245 [Streptomyces xantholiticus]
MPVSDAVRVRIGPWTPAAARIGSADSIRIWCTGVDTMEPGSAAPSDASVARILRADSRPEGAGFRAGRREVITCAHVVAKALGLPPDTQESPDGRIVLNS